MRIHRESEWLIGDQPFGGGTRGPSSRPQTLTRSLLSVQVHTMSVSGSVSRHRPRRFRRMSRIYYFLTHADGNHTMVVADSPMSHPNVPGATMAIYEVIGFAGSDRGPLPRLKWHSPKRSGRYFQTEVTYHLHSSSGGGHRSR